MARERYLLHADEKELPPPEPEPAGPGKKWENFWYYHKWHAAIVLLGVIFAGWLAFDTLSVHQADYQIGMITETSYPADAVEKLENEIARYGADRNGDGRVVVQINNYIVAFGKDTQISQMQVASKIKLETDLTAGDSILFISDEKSFASAQREYSIFALTDGGVPKAGETDMTKMRVPFSKCAKLSALRREEKSASGGSVNVYGGLGLSIRQYKGTGIEGKRDAYYADCKKLFQKLTA